MSDQKGFIDPFDDNKNFSTLEKVRQTVDLLNKQFEAEHGKSGCGLSVIYSPNCVLIADDIKEKIGSSVEKECAFLKKAFSVLKKNADDGDAEAMHLIATYFQNGLPPVSSDKEKYQFWIDKALAAGLKHPGQI